MKITLLSIDFHSDYNGECYLRRYECGETYNKTRPYITHHARLPVEETQELGKYSNGIEEFRVEPNPELIFER